MMQNFMIRTASGAALGLLGLAVVVGGGIWLAFSAAVLAAAMALEWKRLLVPGGGGNDLHGVGFAIGCASTPLAVAAFGATAFVPAVLLVALIGLGEDSFGQLRELPLLLLGAVVAGGAPAALVDLRAAADYGMGLVLWLCIVVIATDVSAYAGGKAFGGRKLAPRLSPGKTWSGTIAGLLAGTAIGAAGFMLLLPEASLVAGVFSSTAVAVITVLGDLCESAFKRRAGVKDSGSLVPGHGGALDRFDGLAASALAVWTVHRAHSWIFGPAVL